MTDRNVPTSASPAPVTGPAYMDAIAEKLGLLFGAAPFALTNVGGSADAITADVDPVLSGAVLNGMSFWLTPVSDNTGTVTLDIGGTGPIAVTSDAGDTLIAGALKSGQRYLLHVVGGELRALGTSGVVKILNKQSFTASGTWNKPAGTADNALVILEMWAGGGGGGTGTDTSRASSGGGGGGYLRREFRAGDLANTVSVTIGAGGSAGSAGGNTTFGSWPVYGGGAGSSNSNSNSMASGGAGGGALSVGGNGTNDTAAVPSNSSVGDPTAGNGGAGNTSASSTVRSGGNAYFGGGGGGGSYRTSGTALGGAGGNSVYGGGGGGGVSTSGIGGTSVFGGAGGNAGSAGQAPGGGGGAGAAGARGEVRIHVIG